jgi:hypothetical protein
MRRERQDEERPKLRGACRIFRGAAEVLEPTKAAFDDVSASIGTFVERMDDDAVGFVGDDRLGAASTISLRKSSPSYLCRRAARYGRCERQNIWRRRDIGIPAWCQMQDDSPAERIVQHGFLSCSRAADCLIVLPLDGIFAGHGQRFRDRAPSSALCQRLKRL